MWAVLKAPLLYLGGVLTGSPSLTGSGELILKPKLTLCLHTYFYLPPPPAQGRTCVRVICSLSHSGIIRCGLEGLQETTSGKANIVVSQVATSGTGTVLAPSYRRLVVGWRKKYGLTNCSQGQLSFYSEALEWRKLHKTLSNRQRTSVCIPLLSSSYASNCQDREEGVGGGRETVADKRRDKNRNSRQE
ncbi:hypothetical protein AOLI_G00244070 [Acnodon oligacanthus]